MVLDSLTLDFERTKNQNGCKIKYIELSVIGEYLNVTPHILNIKTTITYFSIQSAKIIDLKFDEQKGRFNYSTALEITTDVWDKYYRDFASAIFQSVARDNIVVRVQKG